MSNIETKIENNVASIIFNRPEALNAFTSQMYSDFANAIAEANSNKSARVILLGGEGKDFCAGNDITGFISASKLDPDKLADRSITASTNVVHLLAELEKPLIGCIQGRAIGFGATMLLHCDFLIAEPSARLIYPFVNIGIVPEAGCSVLLEQRVGRFESRRMLMLGEPITAKDALKLGLVSELVPEHMARARGIEIANALSSKPNEALRATKRLLNRGPEPLHQRITAEFIELGHRIRSDETQAIMTSFNSKQSQSHKERD